MKRLGVWLPRTNHLKTLLPVMEAAHRHGIGVSVICAGSPGKPALDTQAHAAAFQVKWPWAEWERTTVVDARFDAVIAQGCHGYDAEMIRRTGLPWVAVDHLGENTWARLCWGLDTWAPWHRVCISAPFEGDPEKAVLTGYTAFDGVWPTCDEIRERYGLPERYILLGTAVVPDSLSRSMQRAYLREGLAARWARMCSGYQGPSYAEIVRTLRATADQYGIALVAKSRTKHPEHPVNALADLHIGDDPLDPHRALNLVRASLFYTGLASGMALEAAVAGVPSVNWMAYPQESVDHPGFHAFRHRYWIDDGVWSQPDVSWLYRLYEPWNRWDHMQEMLRFFASGQRDFPGAIAATVPAGCKVSMAAAGPWPGSSVRVLKAAGLL